MQVTNISSQLVVYSLQFRYHVISEAPRTETDTLTEGAQAILVDTIVALF